MTKRSILLGALGVALLGLQAFELWQIRGLKRRIGDAEWNVAVDEKAADDAITPDVGTIQFLKRGYSIQLDSAKYIADGLFLKGLVGNPLNLTLSNLTLKFTATKQLYQYNEDFRRDKFAMIFGPSPIGEAQSSPITALWPRSTAPFEVTIPNVRQTKDGVRILVAFAGERYNY